MLKKLSNYFPSHSLVTFYKAFIRPHLDYAHIYDKANKKYTCSKIQSLQYNATLAFTGAIRGSSKENFTKNQAQNIYVQEDGQEKFVSFIKLMGISDGTMFQQLINSIKLETV